MNIEKVKIMKENAKQSCTTLDTMRDFVVRTCNDLIKSQEMLGKIAYVTLNDKYYYKAKILGYGAYGENTDYNTYCVLVLKEGKPPFVDYFDKIYTEEEYLAWKNKMEEEKFPFGYCRQCHKEFNSELINEYGMKWCLWCGKKLKEE